MAVMPRILIIDDDVTLTSMLRDFLAGAGLDVDTASLGEEGFLRGMQVRPDVILLDVLLPDVTGFQLLDRFRQSEVTRDVPILLMSASATAQNQQDIGRRMGATDYLLKPLYATDLEERLRALLNMPLGTSRPASQQTFGRVIQSGDVKIESVADLFTEMATERPNL